MSFESGVNCRVRVIPPAQATIFSLSAGVYPVGIGPTATIAGGLEVVYQVLFTAKSLSSITDTIKIIPEHGPPFCVEVRAARTVPILDLAADIDVGTILETSQHSQVVVKVTNSGGVANFRLVETDTAMAEVCVSSFFIASFLKLIILRAGLN